MLQPRATARLQRPAPLVVRDVTRAVAAIDSRYGIENELFEGGSSGKLPKDARSFIVAPHLVIGEHPFSDLLHTKDIN